MKKNVALVLIAAVIVVGAAAYIYLTQDSSSNNTPQETPQNGQNTDPEDESKGKYIDYSKSNFNKESKNRRVLFFHASWCPQCRTLDAEIKAGELPKGLTVLKVNYDKETDLRQKYGVTLQTTLVEVDKSGSQVKKFVAYDEPTLEAMLAALK